MSPTDSLICHAALLEAGYDAGIEGGSVVMSPTTPPAVAMKAWQLATGNHAADLADFVAYMISPEREAPGANYAWLEMHGINPEDYT